jgi:hypothetical protein
MTTTSGLVASVTTWLTEGPSPAASGRTTDLHPWFSGPPPHSITDVPGVLALIMDLIAKEGRETAPLHDP